MFEISSYMQRCCGLVDKSPDCRSHGSRFKSQAGTLHSPPRCKWVPGIMSQCHEHHCVTDMSAKWPLLYRHLISLNYIPPPPPPPIFSLMCDHPRLYSASFGSQSIMYFSYVCILYTHFISLQYIPSAHARNFRKEVKEACHLIREIGRDCILSRMEAKARGDATPQDILTYLLDASKELQGDQNFGLEEMIDEFVTFFVAGKNLKYSSFFQKKNR